MSNSTMEMKTVNVKHALFNLLAVSTITFSYSYGVRNTEYGYFDLSFGPSYMEDVEFKNTKSEYKIGPCVSTSIGLTHDNGLGIGLNYIYAYNVKINDLPASGEEIKIDPLESQDAASSTVKLGFVYKFIANTDIALVLNAGPCMVISNDQNLRAAPAEEESTETNAASNTSINIAVGGETDTTPTTISIDSGQQTSDDKTTKAAPIEAESVTNFSFGYNISAGLEYRQDRHNAFGVEIGYTNSHLFKSKFSEETESAVTSAQSSSPLENSYANIVFRYYM
ncbi:hypothetical protein OAT84_01640 [Gammaproteobacteria bacterium]|nr:hypothetical protein [Gammaproteobacteria bacterium]